MSPLIALIGPARCGKDTLAGFLTANHGYTRYAFADALKAAAYDTNPAVIVEPGEAPAFTRTRNRFWEPEAVPLAALVDAVGWEEAKACRAVRALLQRLGVAMRDHTDPDLWAAAAVNRYSADVIDRYPDPHPAVFTDVRFPNEAALLVARGALVVRISRPEHAAALSGEAAAHASETALRDYPADVEVTNGGTLDDLARCADALASMAARVAADPEWHERWADDGM